MSLPGKQIETNGLRFHVAEEGTGPAVLLLHGFPDSSSLWRYQIPALVQAGFRVIAPDLRGFGESDKPAETEAYELSVIVNDVVGLLDALQIQSAHVVCHDWGAIVGWLLAAVSGAGRTPGSAFGGTSRVLSQPYHRTAGEVLVHPALPVERPCRRSADAQRLAALPRLGPQPCGV